MRAIAVSGMAMTIAAGASAAPNLAANGNFNSPGAANAQLLSYGSTFVTSWTIQDAYAAYVPQGQTPDQTWSCCLYGSAGPGYGVNNGLVAPPSGDATVVIDGTYGFGPTGGYGYITQSINGLVAGKTYTLSFWQAGSQEYTVTGDQTQYFSASLGDQTFNSPTQFVPSQGFAPWEKYSTTFTWDGVGNALQIAAVGSGQPDFALLADVSLTGGVPEPATWAMMILGLLGLGVLARRRRTASAVSA
jgi:hypothetical protein